MAEIADLSKTFGLQDGYAQWKADIQDYTEKKRNFQGEAPKYHKVTNAFIKKQDTIYNPITQAYTNNQRE